MSKEELIQLLKEYKQNKARLNIKLKELKSARIKLRNCGELDTNLTASYGTNQDIHSKNQISNKVLNKVEEIDTQRTELEYEIEGLEKDVKELREKVEAVEDRLIGLKYKEREILTAYYIDGRTAQNIGDKLYFQLYNQTRSPRRIQMIIEEATEKMLKL